jgi:hypothetical protein
LRYSNKVDFLFVSIISWRHIHELVHSQQREKIAVQGVGNQEETRSGLMKE